MDKDAERQQKELETSLQGTVTVGLLGVYYMTEPAESAYFGRKNASVWFSSYPEKLLTYLPTTQKYSVIFLCPPCIMITITLTPLYTWNKARRKF